jgi:hypothetical protein
MLDFITPQLADHLLHGLRDLAADVIPQASVAAIVAVLVTATALHLRRRLGAGRRPRRPLPATA